MIGYQDYMEAGFCIIHTRVINEDGSCGCGVPECTAQGKHPVMPKWQYKVEWSEQQIESMRGLGQLNSFGIHCDGYLVVDIDPRNGGNEGYESLCEALDMELTDESGFVVATGGGGRHIYFKVPEGISLKTHHESFVGIDFKSSGFVIGCGSIHKSGNFYEAVSGSPSTIGDAPAELLALLERKQMPDGCSFTAEYSDLDLTDMLSYIDGYDDYHEWVAVGMAAHHATNGDGLQLWYDWSKKSQKCEYGDCVIKWASFGKYSGSQLTTGTLHHMASERGWRQSVTFSVTDEELNQLAQIEQAMAFGIAECPIAYKHIDVCTPPGIAGEITDWINTNCADERKNLAALAAIHALSLYAGASRDIYLTNRKASPNMFSIGLAGSGSGKGDVLECLYRLIEFGGLNPTMAGKIRSERAIYEGLAQNQMFNLVMDEIGIKLAAVVGKKVSEYNAATSGAIMEAYTAGGTLSCDQRVVDERKADLTKKMSILLKQIEENESGADADDVRYQFKFAMERLNGVIADPFFSIFGVSTDDQFKKLITEENIKSGLMGRAIIMQELDAIAEENPHAANCWIPTGVEMRLRSMIRDGDSWVDNHTGLLLNTAERKKVKALPEVERAAREFFRWIKQVGQKHYENGTGYEPLISRCAVKVAKIAGILASDTCVITMEHLEYAVALTIRSTSDLIMRADSISGASSKSAERRFEGLESMVREYVKRSMARKAIIRGVSHDGGYKQADVSRMIEEMLKSNEIVEDKEAKRTSNRAVIYKLVNDEATI